LSVIFSKLKESVTNKKSGDVMEKQNFTATNLLYLILVAIIFVGGYFFLRAAYYSTAQMPFTQEIILIVLGTLATILITATLLNKQTEVELKKEENIKYLELKTAIYTQFLDQVEAMLEKAEITDKDFIKLKAQTHKLSLIASEQFLEQYQNFLNVFMESSEDAYFSSMDINKINEEIAKLCIEIRKDLLSDSTREKESLTQKAARLVMRNMRALKLKTEEEGGRKTVSRKR
jgi:hypothetical protein